MEKRIYPIFFDSQKYKRIDWTEMLNIFKSVCMGYIIYIQL